MRNIKSVSKETANKRTFCDAACWNRQSGFADKAIVGNDITWLGWGIIRLKNVYIFGTSSDLRFYRDSWEETLYLTTWYIHALIGIGEPVRQVRKASRYGRRQQ